MFSKRCDIDDLQIRIRLLQKENSTIKKQLEITRERIIGVLSKYYIEEIDTRPNPIRITQIKARDIATEILGEKREE